jgi:hypothetical protein
MIRDFEGNIVPLGKTARTLEENFLGITALPSWLTVSGSGQFSHSIVPPNADYGYLQLNTGTSQYSSVELNILPAGIDMSKIKEVILEFDSLKFSNTSQSELHYFVELKGTDTGVTLRSDTDNIGSTIRTAYVGGTLDTDINYDPITKDGTASRNLSLRLRADGTFVLAESGYVLLEKKFDNTQLNLSGVIFPKLSIMTRNAGSKWVRLSAARLTIIHN